MIIFLISVTVFENRCYICKFESCRKSWWTYGFIEFTKDMFSKKICIFFQNFDWNIGFLNRFLRTQSSDFFQYSIFFNLWIIKLEYLFEKCQMILMLGWFLYFIIVCQAEWLDNLLCRSLSPRYSEIIESICHFVFIRFYILVIDQNNGFSRFNFIRKERFNGMPEFPIIGDVLLI